MSSGCQPYFIVAIFLSELPKGVIQLRASRDTAVWFATLENMRIRRIEFSACQNPAGSTDFRMLRTQCANQELEATP